MNNLERMGKLPAYEQPSVEINNPLEESLLGSGKESVDDDFSGELRKTIFFPISSSLSSLVFEDNKGGGNASATGCVHETNILQAGSIVGLVGKATFPCVCEVTGEQASLFTDKGACVVAEGVKWQSLYLVIIGRNMVLAEPEKGG